jgi:hypothetical protein
MGLMAQCGALAATTAITVRAVADEPCEWIVEYELGEMLEPLPSEASEIPNDTFEDIPFRPTVVLINRGPVFLQPRNSMNANLMRHAVGFPTKSFRTKSNA